MRPRGSIAGVLVLVVLRATSAWAQELNLRVASDTEFDSNYLALQSNERVSFRSLLGPRISLRDPHGRFTYSLDYLGQFSWYIEPWNSRLNAWEQSISANASYAISRRTQLSVRESFHDLSSVRFGSAEVEDLSDTLDAGQNKFKRNSFGYELSHSFTRRIAGVLAGQHDWLDFERNINRSDSSSMGMQGQLIYSLTSADRVGAGVSFAYQAFEQAVGTPTSRGRIWNAFVSWSHRFTEDFRIDLSGGPTFIESTTSNDIAVLNVGASVDPATLGLQFPLIADCSDGGLGGGLLESTCLVSAPSPEDAPTLAAVTLPFGSGGDTQDDLTYFARIRLTQRWIDWEFSALYSRSESNAAGDGGTSTLDRVLFRLRYDPNQTWDVYTSVGWNRRDRATRPVQIADFVVVDDGNGFAERVSVVERLGSRQVNTDQVSLVLGATRTFSRLLSANLEFRYRYQFRRRTNQNATTNSNFAANFFILNARINYSLAPIRF